MSFELCNDEGCPQHGTPHICISKYTMTADQARLIAGVAVASRQKSSWIATRAWMEWLNEQATSELVDLRLRLYERATGGWSEFSYSVANTDNDSFKLFYIRAALMRDGYRCKVREIDDYLELTVAW